MSKIILGMGYGDEGKGLTTSYLCSQTQDPLVVRFNGGHQAGHTVVYNGDRHVFSSFGSGTLQGVETYWSRYCTVYPIAFMNEYRALPEKVRKTLKISMDRMCPVTLPLDLDANHIQHVKEGHGSVGVGFGATIDRCEKHYNLYVQDLLFNEVWAHKLANIAQYYIKNGKLATCTLDYAMNRMDGFLTAVKEMLEIVNIVDSDYLVDKDHRLIFEGAQGILLDKDFGVFPHVTRSNTTSKQALELNPWAKEIYYVTRCYQTRHGAGFMTNERELGLRNNEKETNKANAYQGNFRTGDLDYRMLQYALTCDMNYTLGMKKNLVITCLDQLPGVDPEEIYKKLETLPIEFNKVFVSEGPSLKDIKQIK